MDQRPLCPALLPLGVQAGSLPILGERGKKKKKKAFSLLNPQCREPLFAGNGVRVDLAAPWAEQPDAGPVPCSHPLLCATPTMCWEPHNITGDSV